MIVDPTDTKETPARDRARLRLERLVVAAKAAHAWEQLWRALIPPLLVAGVFLCVSWLGLWFEVPQMGRLAGVTLFAALFLVSLFGFRRVAPLSRDGALARIDRTAQAGHRPASVLDDTLANAGRDEGTAALWALHRRRAEAQAQQLSAGGASPRSVDLDRYALRAGVLVALVACGFIAGSERYARTAAAFDWHWTETGAPGTRLDAWIDPPPYTGRPPVLFDLASDAARDEAHPLRIEAPVGSVVILRSAGAALDVTSSGALTPPPKDIRSDGSKRDSPQASPLAPGAGGAEQRLILRGDGGLTLRSAGRLRGAFALTAIPDQPPIVMLRDVPKATARGSLTLAYTAGDDYGISSVEATFANPKMDGMALPGPSLVEPPKMALSVPSTQTGLGDGETTGDLSEHPWAGARVTLTLVAHDEGGNEGRSEPVEITLPQKPFANPLARALVEQRRTLVLDPGHAAAVQTALEALMIAPETFKTTASAYLGLRFAVDSLAAAKGRPDLVAVADFLWAMALQLENGDLTDAERALRAAEKDLRDAIERHAPDEEIKKLTDTLQAAMDKFIAELMQKEQRDSQDAEAQQGRPAKTISAKQLQALLDQLREAARSGNKEEAQAALAQLQDLLENLRTAKRQKPDPKARAMAQALNELDQMARDQQDLRDETFKDAQSGAEDQSGSQDSGAPRGQKPQDPGKKNSLEQRQRDLANRLEGTRKRLKQAGQGQEGLDEAGQAMKQADEALAQGPSGQNDAVDEQGKALDGLRKGARKLAEAMQTGGDGEGQEDASGAQGSPDGHQAGQQPGDTDPLGRPTGSPFNAHSTFDPLGAPAAQRAQRVLQELRRRLGDPSRPREETEYLERLLRSY